MSKEIDYFKKKYKIDFSLIADETLAIPEYKITLSNKNKKIIKKIENIEIIEQNSSYNNRNKKNFLRNKNNKIFRSRNKFKRYSKNKRNIPSNKKTINY